MTQESQFFDLLATHVAGGSTIKAAAAEIGMSQDHAYRLSGSVAFRQRVRDMRTEAATQAVCRLSSAATQAADCLVDLLGSDDEKTRLAAAGKLLTMIVPLTEQLEIRERIDALEAAEQVRLAS
jgi:hypothetical protein